MDSIKHLVIDGLQVVGAGNTHENLFFCLDFLAEFSLVLLHFSHFCVWSPICIIQTEQVACLIKTKLCLTRDWLFVMKWAFGINGYIADLFLDLTQLHRLQNFQVIILQHILKLFALREGCRICPILYNCLTFELRLLHLADFFSFNLNVLCLRLKRIVFIIEIDQVLLIIFVCGSVWIKDGWSLLLQVLLLLCSIEVAMSFW